MIGKFGKANASCPSQPAISTQKKDQAMLKGKDLVEKTWDDLDVVVLDLMEMVKSDNIPISQVGLDSLESARTICKWLTKLRQDLAAGNV
jgi:hypothetical protein